MSSTQLPRGIRNRNPGNLRAAVGPDFKTVLVDGFAQFDTTLDGTTSLAYLVWNYYEVLGLKTLPAFVSHYAPASENDVQAYVNAVAKWLGMNPATLTTQELLLDQPWRAIDFIRAIIRVENGVPPLWYNSTTEWVSPLTLCHALALTNKWLGL